MIKEYCEESHVAVIRDGNYGSSLSKFNAFFQEALKDFPSLSPDDVTVIRYGGSRYAKTFGIEFHAADAPASYRRIAALEYT